MKIRYTNGPAKGPVVEEQIESAHIGSYLIVPQCLGPDLKYQVKHVTADGVREAALVGPAEEQPKA